MPIVTVRQKWVDIAKLRIKMDEQMNGLNGTEVIESLVKEFGLRRDYASKITDAAFEQTRAVFVRK